VVAAVPAKAQQSRQHHTVKQSKATPAKPQGKGQQATTRNMHSLFRAASSAAVHCRLQHTHVLHAAGRQSHPAGINPQTTSQLRSMPHSSAHAGTCRHNPASGSCWEPCTQRAHTGPPCTHAHCSTDPHHCTCCQLVCSYLLACSEPSNRHPQCSLPLVHSTACPQRSFHIGRQSCCRTCFEHQTGRQRSPTCYPMQRQLLWQQDR
jgi:hypothetical protein